MQKHNRKLAVLLAVLLALTLTLTACRTTSTPPAGSPDPGKSSAPSDAGNPSDTPANPLRFSAMVKSQGGDDSDTMIQQEWLKLMEEKMERPIEIAFERVPASEYDTKCALKVQTDDMTDFLQLPSMYDRGQISPDMLLDMANYQDLMPNYLAIIDKVPDGRSRLFTADGRIDCFTVVEAPRLPEDHGMSVIATFCYNWTVLQNNDLSIPDTTEELYQTAKALKELYPGSYPINTRWNGFWSVWYMFHCDNQIYWDGDKHVMGQITENYREALRYLNKLYSEKLLDPEYSIETDDTYKSKMLNGQNFISLYEWYQDPANYTRLSTDGTVYAMAFYPDTELYGTSYQHANNANNYTLGWDSFIISADVAEPEEIVKFVDLQYSPEVYELLCWGIEGETFVRNADGSKSFVDSIRTAENPYEETNQFGLQTSTKHRPGFQMFNDLTASVGLAMSDWVYYNGTVHEIPFEQSELVLDIPFPNETYIAPWSSIRAPVIQLSTEEKQERSEILTPINTYRDEMMAKFIKGEKSLDTDWDEYVSTTASLGDYQKVLQMMDEAAAAYYAAN